MHAESVLRLIREYADLLTDLRSRDVEWYARRPQLAEAHMLCYRMMTWAPDDHTADKYHRWCGYIQGLLSATGFRTVEQLRADIRRHSQTAR